MSSIKLEDGSCSYYILYTRGRYYIICGGISCTQGELYTTPYTAALYNALQRVPIIDNEATQ